MGNADAQIPLLTVGNISQLLKHGPPLLLDLNGVLQEYFPCVSQFQRNVTNQKLAPHLFLQRGNVRTEGLLGNMQLSGRLCEAKFPGYHNKISLSEINIGEKK